MIGSLLDYTRQLAAEEGLTTEPGFAPKAVRWAAVFSADGRFLQATELGDTGQKKNPGRIFPKCPELLQPEMKRGGAGCRPFLVDSADVVALLADDPDDPKLQAKHAYFTGLLRQASEGVPQLAAAAEALADPATLAEIRAQLQRQKAKPTERMTLAFLDDRSLPRFPVENDAWHDWWRCFRRGLGGEGSEGGGEDQTPSRHKAALAAPRLALCLGTGEPVEPAPTHPKIAGLADVGGLAMGDALVSFKQESFGSYGLEQSANAPMSEEVASAYRAALNDLLRKYGRALAGAKVVPWFKTRLAAELNPFSWILDDPGLAKADARRRARELLDAIDAGKRPDLAGNRYHVLTLSGAAGRVMIRDWMDGDFPTLLRNAEAWFDDLAIVRRDGDALAPPPKFLAVVGTLARELKEVPLPLQANLFRAAVRRQPIPRQAMAQALQRFKLTAIANETFQHAQVGLLKAWLIRQKEHPMDTHLDENHPEPAYHCGRLMAMYAALQYKALGDVGAGVVQRYFASAIATPALVLGRLARNAQFHLDKLDRGLARWHEGRIADTWGKIQAGRLPATLDLRHQSLFALGYYQQIAADRQKTQSAPATETAAQETTAHV
ncbi:MAG TPA: type I-C CRISPR-associated protein Cas8c/Csd1 [Thermoanaerobaculia bacterium]|nr:type I-C CRISPR-associated protein Cas8c/Csd1 [Thermoanaerobaculia bacterium]